MFYSDMMWNTGWVEVTKKHMNHTNIIFDLQEAKPGK